jgi:hypothetical protein
MKKTTMLMLFLFFSFSLFAQEEESNDTIQAAKTRNKTLNEAFTTDTINKSVLLKAFDGFGLNPVKEAYKINRQTVDSILEADSLKSTFFRVYAYQSVQLFVQANKSPERAMSIFLPIFLILFVIVILIRIIKTFLLRPWLEDPGKPKNDPENQEEEEEEDDEGGEEESSQNQ